MTSALIQILPTLHLLLGLLLAIWTLAFLMRVILTWYPQINITKDIWLVLTIPTEPVLAISRKFVSPIGGVDVTPVIWAGLISLIRELLVGQQGILSQILLRSQVIT